MCAPRRRVSTTSRREPSAISPASRSTSAGSTARRSGSARSAPRNMQSNPIGKLTPRKDSFITHRAFCDALAEERGRITRGSSRSDYNYNPQTLTTTTTTIMPQILGGFGIDDPELGIMEMNLGQNLNNNCSFFPELMVQSMDMFGSSTANIVAHGTLKEEAEEENSTTTTITTTPTHSYHHFNNINSINLFGLMGLNPNTAHHQMGLTRDFLGVGRGQAMGAPFLHHGSSSSFNTLASALDDLTHYNSAHH
ncbi:protein indeterminate-domain 9 [Senna tora]|uniref:Protein indeterminate-domain 9 n=1 Tax=Senna tora TaxID=362788 RepID=A0A834TJR0_9FABA|nr:protein indeterminate-domain 9 [Senna tora]